MHSFYTLISSAALLLSLTEATPHGHRHTLPEDALPAPVLASRDASASNPVFISDTMWDLWCSKMGISEQCTANPSWRPVETLAPYVWTHDDPAATYKITFKGHPTEEMIVFLRANGNGGPYWGTDIPKVAFYMAPGSEVHIAQAPYTKPEGQWDAIFTPFYLSTSRAATGCGAGTGYIEEGQGEFGVTPWVGMAGVTAGLTPSYEVAEWYGRHWSVTGSTGKSSTFSQCSYHCHDTSVPHCQTNYQLTSAGQQSIGCNTDYFEDWVVDEPLTIDFNAEVRPDYQYTWGSCTGN